MSTQIALDSTVCFVLSIGTVVLLVNHMTNYNVVLFTWWMSFMVCNIVYLLCAMKNGSIKGSPDNGVSVAMGPVAWYFWTYLGAWRSLKSKFAEKRKDND